jgi:hypothetical protein
MHSTPNKVTLTCNVTGKVVTWTNKQIIAKKIQQYGSLEAFQAAYVSKGSSKKSDSVAKEVYVQLKPIFEQGVALGKLTQEEYAARYITRTHTYKDGTTCTITTPTL